MSGIPELEIKQEVILKLGKWIIEELENTSSVRTESILPSMITEFTKLLSN